MPASNHYLYDLARRWGLSDFGARTVEFWVGRPLRILLIVAVAWVIARLGARAAASSVRTLSKRAPLRTGARSEKRIQTMTGVAARLVRLATAVVAFLMVLSTLGVNLAPLLAGAGVAGVALGLGAQSLVRDMLAGVFIIGEDQYGVGDSIDLGVVTGIVEDVNLRNTRLRAVDGTVWFVPNGQITRAGNASLDYSKALIDIPLTYGADLAAALHSVTEVVDAFATDEAWSNRLMERPSIDGVHEMDATGPTVRVEAKTAPREQDAVAAELRRRLIASLAGAHLLPGTEAR